MTTTLQPWQRVRVKATIHHDYGVEIQGGREGLIIKKVQNQERKWVYNVWLDEGQVMFPFSEEEIEAIE